MQELAVRGQGSCLTLQISNFVVKELLSFDAQFFKPELARCIISVIGATVVNEYAKFIELGKDFERCVQNIIVDKLDAEAVIYILRGVKHRFENYSSINNS